jgi:hypothetical protein
MTNFAIRRWSIRSWQTVFRKPFLAFVALATGHAGSVQVMKVDRASQGSGWSSAFHFVFTRLTEVPANAVLEKSPVRWGGINPPGREVGGLLIWPWGADWFTRELEASFFELEASFFKLAQWASDPRNLPKKAATVSAQSRAACSGVDIASSDLRSASTPRNTSARAPASISGLPSI